MLFSATLDRNVDLLVRRYLHEPNRTVRALPARAGRALTAYHAALGAAGRWVSGRSS